MDTPNARGIDGRYCLFGEVEGLVVNEYARVGCSTYGINKEE